MAGDFCLGVFSTFETVGMDKVSKGEQRRKGPCKELHKTSFNSQIKKKETKESKD